MARARVVRRRHARVSKRRGGDNAAVVGVYVSGVRNVAVRFGGRVALDRGPDGLDDCVRGKAKTRSRRVLWRDFRKKKSRAIASY